MSGSTRDTFGGGELIMFGALVGVILVDWIWDGDTKEHKERDELKLEPAPSIGEPTPGLRFITICAWG
jgi:hypothetical protein